MSEVTEEERTRYEEEEDVRDSPSDSSEESEEDEEEIQKVREGFIVDDEEDEVQTKRESPIRERDKERPHYDDALDDDDLELLLENSGLKRGSLSSGKFKRLKRKQIEDDEDEIESQDHQGEQQLRDIFSDDEEVEEEAAPRIMDEFDGFIEEDDFSDEDEQTRLERRNKERRRSKVPELIRRTCRTSTDKVCWSCLKCLAMAMNMTGHWRHRSWKMPVPLTRKSQRRWTKCLNIRS